MVLLSGYQDPMSPAAWRPIPDYSAWDILSYSPLGLGRTFYSDRFFSIYALANPSAFPYQIKHLVNFGRWHSRGRIVLDEQEAIVFRSSENLLRSFWIRGRDIDNGDIC